jgi:two-component system sensor histidine kinase VicK
MESWNVQIDQLEEIANYLTEGVVFYNIQTGKVTYTNSAAADLVGDYVNASPGEIESLLELVVPDDREYLKNSYRQLKNKRAIEDVEFRMQIDNIDLFVCCNAYLLSDDTTVVIYLSDITRTRQYENYLVEFGARKNTLLDTLTHHISGALNLMQHLSAEAEKHFEDSTNDNVKTYIGLLKENSKRSIEIINDLMRKEHLKSPAILVRRTRIDVIEKISFIHQELQQAYIDRTFVLVHPGEPIYIFADDVKLLQVVNNYLSNAIKFSPPAEPIQIKIAENRDEVVIGVSDHGIGIPDDLQPYIFDRNGHAGRTGLNGEKSIGLGLWICKNLIELMSGHVWFESAEGRGSTFYLSLPKNSQRSTGAF